MKGDPDEDQDQENHRMNPRGEDDVQRTNRRELPRLNEILDRREKEKNDGEDGEENVHEFRDDSMGVLFGVQGMRLSLLDFGRLATKEIVPSAQLSSPHSLVCRAYLTSPPFPPSTR